MAKNMDAFLGLVLLSSSSSSEDEENYIFLKERAQLPKIKRFVDDVVEKFNEKQFQKFFRLRKETADLLVYKFQLSRHFPKNEGHGGREPITGKVHIYSFLWFAVNKCTIKDVAQRFNMTESSFHRVMKRVVGFVLELGPDIIKLPKSQQELQHLENEFKKIAGFPGTIGCIDGTYISIRTPAHKVKSTYVNRHDIPSIVLQGICDHKRRFIDIFTGIPAKVHDARVFKMSDVSVHLPIICGTTYHIIGDGAYYIRPWLLTPYKDYGKLTHQQIKYNSKFCATRVLIENTFGILKGRFRQLIRLDLKAVVSCTKFIITCCILHNFCIDVEDFLNENNILHEEQNHEDAFGETDWQQKKRGEEKRESIKAMLSY